MARTHSFVTGLGRVCRAKTGVEAKVDLPNCNKAKTRTGRISDGGTSLY